MSEPWQELEPWPHQGPGARRVRILARIRDNTTGEVREGEECDTIEAGAAEPNDFGWSEGSFSCDCNRELFFARYGDEEDPEETECGETRYSVELVNPASGRVFYGEFKRGGE